MKLKKINSISPMSLTESFKGFFEYKNQIKQVLSFILTKMTSTSNNNINSICEYYFNLSGKMIRPHFLIQISAYLNECNLAKKYNIENLDQLSYNNCNYNLIKSEIDNYFNTDFFKQIVLPYAACIEAIHNASLLQDDILDDANLRRSNLTAHKKYGIKNTVFASDYIISKSTDIINDLNYLHLNEVYSTIIYNLACGEYQQTIKRNFINSTDIVDVNSNLVRYLNKTYYKTSSLIAESFRGLGIIHNVSVENQKYLFNLGLHLGLVFQLTDDIFDVLGDESVTKKPSYKDLKEGIINCHIIYECLGDNKHEIIKLIERKFKENNDLNKVIDILNKGDGILKTQNLSLDHLLEAINILNNKFFVESNTKNKLIQGIVYMFNRKF